MIGLGIIAATLLARPRAIERGFHPDTPVELLVWVVPAGVIGARLYHVITDWVPLSQWYKIWEGGLGIPGGILVGFAGGLLFAKRRGLDKLRLGDAMVPVIPLAQAIGRWGNWWNQELYGRPTDLPWGLEIDAQHRAQGFEDVETFHPTFLYESLWNLALVGFLIWIDRRRVLKPGRLVFVYAAGYAIGRLWIEALRIDQATKIAGVRINLWTMGIVLLVSLFILSRSLGRGGDAAAALAKQARSTTGGAALRNRNDGDAEDRAEETHSSADEEE